MTAAQPMKRLQVLLPPDSYATLQQLAAEADQSVSALVRETIEEYLVKEARIERKKEALARMFEMELPVDDWEVMEHEIEKRWEECEPDD
jgi:predicted transcriptional regulator